MSDLQRRPLAEMARIADALVNELRPYCVRIAIAGSIRRRKPDVGDVEILCIPKFELSGEGDLFAMRPVDLLHQYCALRTDGIVWAHRLDKNGRPAFGQKFKRLLIRERGDIPLDLFSTTSDQWGLVFMIRTGPAEFSKRMVTKREWGGCLPNDLRIRDGAIWRGDQMVPCPEEFDFFRLCGLGFVEPEKR